MTLDLDHLDHLDDPTPPKGQLPTVRNLAADRSGRRRRTVRRRAGSVAVAGSLIAVVVFLAVAIPDSDDDIDLVPGDTSTPMEVSHATSLRWKANGLDYEFALLHPQGVAGGLVSGKVTITNNGNFKQTHTGRCFDPGSLAFSSSHGRDITGDMMPPMECRVSMPVDPGTSTTWTVTGQLAADAEIGAARAYFTDDENRGYLALLIVEPVVRAELVPSDTSLGSGQIIDVELVLRNDTDALIPFPAPGPQCPVMFQAQVVDAGSEPPPFAWPGVSDCELAERVLEPGTQVVATAEVEVPEVGREAEIIGAIDVDWPAGFTPPSRVSASVQRSNGPSRTVTWHIEPAGPVEVEPGGTATFELVVTAAEPPGPWELGESCPLAWEPTGSTPALGEQRFSPVACNLHFDRVEAGFRYQLQVRAVAIVGDSERPLPPGTYSLGGFLGIEIVVAD